MDPRPPGEPIAIEALDAGEHGLIRRLLVDLYLEEQPHFEDHPQLTRAQAELTVDRIPGRFQGENVVFAVREGDGLAAFCWCVLFDPGTGLEGEVAELYVGAPHRGRGIGEALVKRAVRLFQERGVTLGYVWTRPENEGAVRLYRRSGFAPNRQLVLTWYPATDRPPHPSRILS
ncbi:MAG: GNAT family N-acetyltransferase [Candidatus Dormibacteraceae bacterium]